MERTANTDQPAKRMASVTGFAIPVGRFRKLSGEPGPDGAKATDCLIIPAGAIGRYPADKWGEFGSVRTYRFWQGVRKVPPSDVVPSTRVLQPRTDQRSPLLTGGLGESSRGDGESRGRRSPLSRMRDLSQADSEAANGLCNLRTYGRRPLREREEGSPVDVHPELLDLCSEGGSEPSDSRESSDSEEVEECSVHGSDHNLCDAGCRTIDGFLVYSESSGSSSEGGRDSEESDDVEEQEGPDSPASEAFV